MGDVRIVLIGAGGHGRVVWDTLQLIRERDNVQVAAVLDDDARLWGRSFQGLAVQGPVESIARAQADAALIAIGDNRVRQRVYAFLQSLGIPLANAIHPTAVLGRDVRLGSGIVAFAHVVVNIGAQIRDNVILNTACTVDHDSIVGAHAHLAPGVHLAGGVNVGEGALIGIGSVALPGVTIGEWATVGAGSSITHDLPAGVTAFGAPARVLSTSA